MFNSQVCKKLRTPDRRLQQHKSISRTLLHDERPVIKITLISYIFNQLQLKFFGTGKYTRAENISGEFNTE
jgi:hypothetical protein